MKFKKILSAILTSIILASTVATIPVNADAGDTDALFVISNEIPSEVTNYAKGCFSNLTTGFLLDMEFTAEEVNNLHLAKGFTPYEYDDCDLPLYYFPVMNGDCIIALLKVIDHGANNYSFQFGKSDFANLLNNVISSEDSPVVFVITDEAMYSLDENDEFDLMETFIPYNTNPSSKRSAVSLANEPIDLNFSEVIFDNETLVEISDDSTYSDTITSSSNARSAPSNNALSVPFVGNGTTTDYPSGICWASAAASVIKYRANPSDSATVIRDNIVAKGYDATHPNITKKMAAEIKDYVGSSTYKTTVSFSTVKSKIDAGVPLYTRWGISTGGGHALVMRSYEVDSSGNESVGFMDPNYNYYTAMTFGTSFSNGTKIYTWTNTIY